MIERGFAAIATNRRLPELSQCQDRDRKKFIMFLRFVKGHCRHWWFTVFPNAMVASEFDNGCSVDS
jgi:hypothetical protein